MFYAMDEDSHSPKSPPTPPLSVSSMNETSYQMGCEELTGMTRPCQKRARPRKRDASVAEDIPPVVARKRGRPQKRRIG